MQKLSKREKLMLYVLLLVGIVVGGFMGLIKPAIDKNLDISTELDTISMEALEVETKIASLPGLEIDLAKKQEELANMDSKLFSLMTNDQIDAMLTNMLQSAAFSMFVFTMGDTEVAPMVPFGIDVDETNSAETEQWPQVYCKLVTIEAEARLLDLVALIDTVSANASMRITTLTAAAASASANNPMCQVDMTIEVYMDPSSSVSDSAVELNVERDPNANSFVDPEPENTETQPDEEELDALREIIREEMENSNTNSTDNGNADQPSEDGTNLVYNPNYDPATHPEYYQ